MALCLAEPEEWTWSLVLSVISLSSDRRTLENSCAMLISLVVSLLSRSIVENSSGVLLLLPIATVGCGIKTAKRSKDKRKRETKVLAGNVITAGDTIGPPVTHTFHTGTQQCLDLVILRNQVTRHLSV